MQLAMLRDYIWYIARVKKEETYGILLNLAILLFSILLSFVEGPSLAKHFEEVWMVVLVLLLMAVKIFREIGNFLYEVKKFFDFERADLKRTAVSWRQIQPSEKESERGFELAEFDRGAVLYSNAFDTLLQTGKEWQVVFSHAVPRRIRHLLREHHDIFIKFLSHHYNQSRTAGRYFINENKFCLSEDIDPASGSVVCHAGTYYDSFLTNEIAGMFLEDKGSGKRLADATFLLPVGKDPKGALRFDDITTSQFNNHIGVSTLGITADRYLILWKQNAYDQQSSDLLIPTGSGSCALTDWQPGGTLNGALKCAMERELQEESLGLQPGDIRPLNATRLIGFFRWLGRGGKPEFVGVTKLSKNLIEFEPNHQEVKADSSHGLHSVYVPTLAKLIDTLDDLSSRGDLSLPLAINLLRLREYCERFPEEAKQFLAIG